MISHKLFEYICNLLKSIYQLSWVIKTSIICRPMCLCVFRILLFLTPMFYAVAKQIWHMIDGQNLNYVHGQTIQRFRQWYDWTVSGIFTFNLRMPWGSSNKNVKKSFSWTKLKRYYHVICCSSLYNQHYVTALYHIVLSRVSDIFNQCQQFQHETTDTQKVS